MPELIMIRYIHTTGRVYPSKLKKGKFRVRRVKNFHFSLSVAVSKFTKKRKEKPKHPDLPLIPLFILKRKVRLINLDESKIHRDDDDW